MTKSSRFRYSYRENASNLHCKVGDILRTSNSFKFFLSYQEYPVKKINPKYHSNAHKFDWVIPKLQLVIECHGKQHYEVTTFGADVEEAIDAFHGIQTRDNLKKNAALQVGYRYVIISYKEEKEITEDLILKKIKESDVELEEYISSIQDSRSEIPSTRKELLNSESHKKYLQFAKDKRKEFYKKMKTLKKGGP